MTNNSRLLSRVGGLFLAAPVLAIVIPAVADHRLQFPAKPEEERFLMNSLKALFLALILAVSTPVIVMAEEHAAEKVAVTELPAAVKAGFTKEVPGGEMTSAKKLGGDKPRYLIMYKLEGKEHQITLGEDGVRTKKAKKAGEKEGAK